MRFVICLVFHLFLVAARQTNVTIVDDGDITVVYAPSPGNLACWNCTGAAAPKYGLDATLLHDGTFTILNSTDLLDMELELIFTGTALYINLDRAGFYMDGARVAGPTTANISAYAFSSTQGQYNVPIYTNPSIANGRHQFIINGGNNIVFDYAVYTSSEPDTSSSDPLLESATLTSGAQPSTTASSSPTVSQPVQSSSRRKPPIAAIAGAIGAVSWSSSSPALA
ncbi:hypothetical protein C8R47DRAFT_1220952 [Mycena vitilis]|nr:hypothetical protein C8R47DRAFT_1220952 [Mycena vitilis]